MENKAQTRGAVRFGAFEADLRAHELRKHGLRIRLQDHPFRLLAILLEHPGEVVTREEIQKRLWPDDTFVEFDHSVNTAIQKIRQALGDSASHPRFLETLPRRGYRFVAPVEGISTERAPPAGKPRRLLWAAGLTVVALIAGIAAWHKTPETPLTAVPLTSYPGSELEPSFSPDGEEVAFSWNGEKEDNWDIYVKRIGPGEPRRLTTHPGVDFSPAFSPDGDWVAFHRRLAPEKGAVMLVPAPGGSERKIADTYLSPNEFSLRSGLAWSADGKWLVFPDRVSAEDTRQALFLFSVETGEKRQLTEAGTSHPVVSPDGRTLVFHKSGPGIFGLALSENFEPIGPPKLLGPPRTYTTRPAWTRNGRNIIFHAQSALWRIAASGKGAAQRLAHVGEGATFVAVAPRGNRLVYTRRIRDHNIWLAELPFPGGKAGTTVKLIASTRHDGDAEYSPDGKRIVFVSNRSGPIQLWVCDSDGSNRRVLTDIEWGGEPSWSPDGQQVAFDSVVDGRPHDIYVVRAEGGAPRRVTTAPSTEVMPRWSRDGKWIYFGSERTGDMQVWKMPAGPPPEPENAIQVTKGGGIAAVESLDGRFLYYAKSGGVTSLWRVPVDGGEETQILEPVHYRSFVVVEEGVYFRKSIMQEGPILFFSFATSEVTEIGAFGKPSLSGLTVSPDGRHILYGQIDQEGDDLMLVENFR